MSVKEDPTTAREPVSGGAGSAVGSSKPRTARSALGASLPHESAMGHVTGSARYIDDLPVEPGTLHGVMLSSPHPRALILSKDATEARAVPGVHAILFADDLPADNQVGPVVHDEVLLAEGAVYCVGQHVAVVYAESRQAARVALSKIQVEYLVLPAVVGLAEAIEAEQFIGQVHQIARGDVDSLLKSGPHLLSGEVQSGGQEHFYLETHAALARPGDDGSVQVLSSTQHPTEVQTLVAAQLGIGRHQVSVICPRMGGAFGGKETQAAQYACFAALGAQRLGRPVRVWLDRDTDMQITGRRHPFLTRYQVAFEGDGRITAFDASLYCDAGWASDLSQSILDRGLFHIDNGYSLPVVRLRGYVVRTHKVSNTAFRGFGGPQGMVVMEQVLDRIAAHLGLDPLQVRRRNLYSDENGWHTPYGQKVERFHLPSMIDDLVGSSSLEARRAEITRFNEANRWRKRGLALSPVKFGISFTASFLNQAGALVVLYADGTAQINHGGTEMGQGLYTKMLQVAAHGLGVELSRLRQMPTSTEKVPNTSATAASSGSDLNGEAVRRACETLVGRLLPVACELLEAEPDEVQCAAGWSGERPLVEGEAAWAWTATKAVRLSEVAALAYVRQISLSATGFYRTPDIGYDRALGRGRPFHYFAYGAAVSEVELCGLTGAWRLRRVDILHDVGDTLSHDIDRGQIEGGYIQGLGWLTCEELVFDDRGGLSSHSPSTYKIPAIGEAPEDFRVSFLQHQPEPGVIYGSKAVGEPPFMLAISAHLALSRAASAFGPPGTSVQAPIPATVEGLAMTVQRARSS